MKWASSASILLACSLLLMKAVVWHFSRSTSVLASTLDSFMDIGASLISFVAIRYALQPADNEHRFGHGKAEALAAFMQSFLIVLSAFFIIINGVRKIYSPHVVEHSEWAIGVMLFAALSSAVLVAFQRYVVKKTGSPAIKADSVHYETDILSSLLVLFAIVLNKWAWPAADPILALFIALYLIKEAWGIMTESFNVLMDHELEDEDKKEISDLILSHSGVRGFHDFRSRSGGAKNFIQYHLEFADERISLKEAHGIGLDLEVKICNAFPNTEILMHFDYENDEREKHE